jgi:hypothetical protein
MDDTQRPRRLSSVGLVAAGLVGGLVLAGVTAAGAQSGDPATRPDARPDARKHGRHLGHLERHALHGEFTVRDPAGGFRTMATQRGTATAVSASSITVKSEDGFSRTYVVNDDTLVKAGDEGTGDIATGDEVRVVAIVSDGTARAVQVLDVTTVSRLREQWRPGRARP